jgi:hypothetical protein
VARNDAHYTGFVHKSKRLSKVGWDNRIGEVWCEDANAALRACVVVDLFNKHLICFEEKAAVITQLGKSPTGQLRKPHFRLGHWRRRTLQKPIG